MKQIERFPKDLISGLIFLGLGVAIWLYSASFPAMDEGYPGPALFPRLVSVGFGLCALFLLLPTLKPLLSNANSSASTKEGRTSNKPYSLLGGIVLIALYPVLHEFLGFAPALGICIFAMGLLLELGWLKAALVAVGTVACIYLLFNVLLGVPL